VCEAAAEKRAAECAEAAEGGKGKCEAPAEAMSSSDKSSVNEAADRTNAHWDHYAVLQVPLDFTRDELRRAYRSASLAMHPDKHGGSDEAFQRVAEAHQILSADDKKGTFDNGDDLKRERMRDGGEGPSVKEQLVKKYFPEKFDFEPFDNSEANEHKTRVLQKQEERRANLAHQKAQELEAAGESEPDENHEDDLDDNDNETDENDDDDDGYEVDDENNNEEY